MLPKYKINYPPCKVRGFLGGKKMKIDEKIYKEVEEFLAYDLPLAAERFDSVIEVSFAKKASGTYTGTISA